MPRKRLISLMFLTAILAGALAVGLYGIDSQFLFNQLSENRDRLVGWVGSHGVLAAGLFVATYIASTAFSIPGGAVLTMAAGFLFGITLGGILSVVGATIGAMAVFLFARTALGEPLRARAGPWFRRVEAGFRANALSYLIVLRLVPVFPFWLVNLLPALVGVPLLTYALGTFIGIIPGSVIFVSLGSGLDAVFRQCEAAKAARPGMPCEPPNVADVFFAPEVIVPLAGLCLIALAPVAIRRFWRRGGLVAPPAGEPHD